MDIDFNQDNLIEYAYRKLNNIEKSSTFYRYCNFDLKVICPYINPSVTKRLLFCAEYKEDELRLFSSQNDLEEGIFWITLAHAECFRQRRANVNKENRLLICDNIIYNIEKNNSEDILSVISWTHWILKIIFSKYGIMFGKFWRGEQLNLRRGGKLPNPMQNFISVRSFVDNRDKEFVSSQINIVKEFEKFEKKENIPVLPCLDKLNINTVLSNNSERTPNAYIAFKKIAKTYV